MNCGVPSRKGTRTSDALMLGITELSQVVRLEVVDVAWAERALAERVREATDRPRRPDMAAVSGQECEICSGGCPGWPPCIEDRGALRHGWA